MQRQMSIEEINANIPLIIRKIEDLQKDYERINKLLSKHIEEAET